MGTLSVWASMRMSIFSGPMIFTMDASEGMVCGPSCVEPLWKKPASCRLTTVPSLFGATEMMRSSICSASASSSFFCNSSILGRASERALRRIGQLAQVLEALDVLDELHLGNRRGFAAGERHLGAGSVEDAHLLEGQLDGHGQLAGFAFVNLRGGIKNHEKCKHGVERQIPNELDEL